MTDNFFGSLLGLVFGDAIGARFEGLPVEQLHQSFRDPLAAFDYSLNRDHLRFTDDGQMTLALAEYLTTNSTIVPSDLMRCFVHAYEPWRGYGRGARMVIEAFRDNADYEFMAQHLFPGGSLGNGAAMRSAPVGLRFAGDQAKIWEEAKQSAWPTHRHELGIEGAQLIALAIDYALNNTNITPRTLASFLLPFCITTVFQNRLEKLERLQDSTQIAQFGNGIEAHESVVTALACFALHPRKYREAIAEAIWQGGDTDTIAAMTGALVGAHIGSEFAKSLPLDRIEDGQDFIEYLRSLAKGLGLHHSPHPKPSSTRSSSHNWFAKLTGFSEESAEQVRSLIALRGGQMNSLVNDRTFTCGHLEIVSLCNLKQQLYELQVPLGKLTISEVVGDVQALHVDPANAGSVFQVASQFNLLEMVSPDVTPELGIGIYERDPTQGPACAVACGAGTIYRNYFVPLNGQLGQTKTNQIDCLEGIGTALGNHDHRLWKMQNGYALPSHAGLKEIITTLQSFSETALDEVRDQLLVGIQWDTQVTLNDCEHQVTQVYCSALPVAYSGLDTDPWEPFARLVLEAAYEATLVAAILNGQKSGNRTVYLTLLGGGVFGNEQSWILDAIRRAVGKYKDVDVEVKIVSFGQSNPAVRKLCG